MARKKVIEIVLDTETTGLDYTKEKMVEFAAVRLENGKIKDEFQTLINPEQHIRKSSIAIAGEIGRASCRERVMPLRKQKRCQKFWNLSEIIRLLRTTVFLTIRS